MIGDDDHNSKNITENTTHPSKASFSSSSVARFPRLATKRVVHGGLLSICWLMWPRVFVIKVLGACGETGE